MVVHRGDVWWTDLGEPRGSGPGYRRPLLIVQADAFNHSRLRTVIAVGVSSNLGLLDAPGNVLLARDATGLPRDSVANVSQCVTVDEDHLEEWVGRLPPRILARVADGLGLILGLEDSD